MISLSALTFLIYLALAGAVAAPLVLVILFFIDIKFNQLW